MKKVVSVIAVALFVGAMSTHANAQDGVTKAQDDLDAAMRFMAATDGVDTNGKNAVTKLDDFDADWRLSGKPIDYFKANGQPMSERLRSDLLDSAYGVWAQIYLNKAFVHARKREWADAWADLMVFEHQRGMADKPIEDFYLGEKREPDTMLTSGTYKEFSAKIQSGAGIGKGS
jgi:hypothetical protein